MYRASDILPCPFCGRGPEIEPWHGGGANKRRIGCQNDECHVGPSTTGPTAERAIWYWNTRKAMTVQVGDWVHYRYTIGTEVLAIVHGSDNAPQCSVDQQFLNEAIARGLVIILEVRLPANEKP